MKCHKALIGNEDDVFLRKYHEFVSKYQYPRAFEDFVRSVVLVHCFVNLRLIDGSCLDKCIMAHASHQFRLISWVEGRDTLPGSFFDYFRRFPHGFNDGLINMAWVEEVVQSDIVKEAKTGAGRKREHDS